MMSGSVSFGRYIVGVTYSRPLLRPRWCSSTIGAPSKLPPTLPSFARNSAMVGAFQSFMANSCLWTLTNPEQFSDPPRIPIGQSLSRQIDSERGAENAQVCARHSGVGYVGRRPGRWIGRKYDGGLRGSGSDADPVVQAGHAEPGGIAEAVWREAAQADRAPEQ